ncbi:NPC intracellular cholesterol transporter 1-like [Macrobrachium nipponense]|uniref:NPC intracellular cholesterol transporter 1-like n=1 Tax=Macrobrachium nipponense TaxID=159736 RepID=UPI0030C80637
MKPISRNVITTGSGGVVNCFDRFFFKCGRVVSGNPWKFILGSILVTALSSLGFLNLHVEQRAERLWIPQDSDYVKTMDWQAANFPQDQRLEMILYEAEDNVLKADYVRTMFQIHQEVMQLIAKDGYGNNLTLENVCFRIPAIGGQEKAPEKLKKKHLRPRDPEESFDWSLALEKEVYYQVFSALPTACVELSILEAWGYDPSTYQALEDGDVVDAINSAKALSTFAIGVDFTDYLGGVTRNATGHVTGAKTALVKVVTRVNKTEVDRQDLKRSHAGLAERVDKGLFNWEGEYIQFLKNFSDLPDGLRIIPFSQRSFGEISSDTIMGDVLYLAVGSVVLFIYVQVMLGSFNMVEGRSVLSMLGILAAFMAVAISFGLCAGIGLPYGPVHSILPLLLLGLGVDDMFVIIQSFNNLDNQEESLPEDLRTRMGLTLRHAGVAVTVTSLTDFAAFLIGATTVLPALRSFCIYSAVGVLVLYVLQITFFTAWFTLDQRRLEDNRNGALWCYKHENWSPNKCSRKEFFKDVFAKYYTNFLLKKPVKILVLLATLALFCACAWGVTGLRQEFNMIWFIPQTSYLFQFLSRLQVYYPGAGERGTVYLGLLDYPRELYKVGNLTKALQENKFVSHVDSWFDAMADYTLRDVGEDIRDKPLNDSFFRQSLSAFLFSPAGAKYQTYFHFDGNLAIGKPAPSVLASKFDYVHCSLDERDEQIQAMEEVKQLIKNTGFSAFAEAIAFQYAGWETNKIIFVELIRNLCLALTAVLVMTLVLLANFLASAYVLVCVVFTLIDVMALMTWWGLTVDIITCINLVLCIGLCVDYSVHIALHFLRVTEGCRDARVRQTVREIGSPVINGACSTFLAIAFLAFSSSHVFITFYKIFFGVFIFGVYHGLVFLPVVLSLIGPLPPTHDESCRNPEGVIPPANDSEDPDRLLPDAPARTGEFSDPVK